MQLPERVVLVGLSGTGKTVVGQALARQLGYALIDTDALVEARFGCPVAEIFRRYGEPVFRAAEREAVRIAARQRRAVVATGGGVVLDEANWAALRPGSVIVHLRASLPTLLARLRAQSGAQPGRDRPLLQGDPAARLAQLWEARRHFYARADLTVDTDGRTPEELAAEIARAVAERQRRGLVPALSLLGQAGRSDIVIGPGVIGELGTLVSQRWPQARTAFVVSDQQVWPHWGTRVTDALASAGLRVESRAVPAGEASKSWETAGDLLDWLLACRVDRRDVVVAVGGGVVGDLAGFVAAVVLRGIGFAQVPTSLLAMVDASVGGKTAVNHRFGKNLIGAFYQPALVVIDPETLTTLPDAELRAGWAEVVKHAMIECTATGASHPALLAALEAVPLEALRLEPAEMTALIQHNVAIKAAVVQADEREDGLRRILNYGHTFGHAFEAAAYRYRHGEAVALGMRAEARLAQRLGLVDDRLVARQDALLDRLGLPRQFVGDIAAVLARLPYDKKAVHGRLTWVLPTAPGQVIITDQPSAEDVAAIVAAVSQAEVERA